MPARSRLRLPRIRKGGRGFAASSATADRLADLDGVRDNPGNLRARCYVPADLRGPAPLVVVLHGCTQDAAAYDHGSGWSTLADRHGFLLLFPEQRRANNPMLCFNWFSGDDTRRGAGEAASIRSMIDAMARAHEVDPSRIFVTGLSAGGAMASAMLATYPEVFAAGAILAGVAYGCAADVGQAFDCMGGRGGGDPGELAGHVRRASAHEGPWPRIQVWQGSADRTVVPSNAESIVLQWRELHGLGAKPDRSDRVKTYPRRTWLGPEGEPLIEHVSITGMAHGVPLAGDGLGEAGPHMLDVGLSSTERIATFFGIAEEAEDEGRAARAPASPLRLTPAPAAPPQAAAASGVQAVIEDALRKAGLMR
jgi:poly(hydroxyalkanoate) depolymerase family esterase